MIDIVVDASVGIKWFIPEIHSAEARQWRGVGTSHVLAVFFDIEIANTLWKKTQRSELSTAEAEAILSQIETLPVARHDESHLLGQTFDLAVQTQRSVYDCLYLALAVELSGRLVTADLRLFNGLAATPFSNYVTWVANVPTAP